MVSAKSGQLTSAYAAHRGGSLPLPGSANDSFRISFLRLRGGVTSGQVDNHPATQGLPVQSL
ncbi:hypothetical protein LLE49_15065, partial [Alicyclobacillus tolerans]|uniref:hypothetical protein n=1 Tax=Alicyclobacillus tolerans TaxID=90970 RepID=UPI001F3B6113